MNNNAAMIEQMRVGSFDYSDPKIRTAYALNLCTVSVSQIIDYNDIVVLEQEYETILNNLNIERMPKDEALLKILKQLMDTITFFRIQEVDKQYIDREYQNKMKNAIWNAVPNLGMLLAGGNFVTMAISLASQVGIGYMNYRKAKAENTFAHEKAMWQLQRAAIEQFNGLRRELFDTAWRLVDAYDLPDEYRLTERQVKQYNEILMDPDPARRYERLDVIKEFFVAYPPFWYFFGNTAAELMRMTEGQEAEMYRQIAMQYFEIFIRSFSACNLLRENQVASACALEYIDLLPVETNSALDKVSDLLQFALKMSGNANDVLQLCAFAYLKIGDIQSAAHLFRRLVNENYNTVVNSQLLSGYYVSAFLYGDNTAYSKYKYLCERTEDMYLYPFPDKKLIGAGSASVFSDLQEAFVRNQKEILVRKFEIVISLFRDKFRVCFNRCIPVPEEKKYSDQYFSNSVDAYAARKADCVQLRNKKSLAAYVEALQECDYPYNYLLVLNDLLDATSFLDCVHGSENALLSSLSNAIIQMRSTLLAFKEKIEDGSKFTPDTYNEMLEVSYDHITEEFFEILTKCAGDYVRQRNDIVSMNEAETNLREFCLSQGLETPDKVFGAANNVPEMPAIKKTFLGIELIDEGTLTTVANDRFEETKEKITTCSKTLCVNSEASELITCDQEAFDRYFIRLEVPNKREIRRKTVAILDDHSARDRDLLFTTEGVMQIVRGAVKTAVAYDDIALGSDNNSIILHQRTYSNTDVNMENLINLILSLRTKPFAEVKDKNIFDSILDRGFKYFKPKKE